MCINTIMVKEFTYEEKLLIAELIGKGHTPYQISREFKLPKDRLYRALEKDEELVQLCEEFRRECEQLKARARLDAMESLRKHFEERNEKLNKLYFDILDVSKEVIERSDLCDRMRAAKMLLEMIKLQAADSEEDSNIDETPAIIEVVVEDASGGE